MLSMETARIHSDNRCSAPQVVSMARDSPSVGSIRYAKRKSQFTQPADSLRRQQRLNRFPGMEKCPIAEKSNAPCSK
jgi:hypothetical protein